MIRHTTTREKVGQPQQIQALVRGLDVLRYLNRVGVASNTIVAKRFQLKVSTAHRMLMVLTRMGMLRHDVRGHQFILASRVRTLSAGFRESRFIDEIALPRMQAWTRRHGIRLLLVTEDNGELTVLASTSAHWPLTRELPVAGNTLAETRSSEAVILRRSRNRTGKGSTSTGSHAVLRRRVVVRTVRADREKQISVLILTDEGFRGSLSLRCSTDIIGSAKEVRHWAAELRNLAAGIVGANDRFSTSNERHPRLAR